MNLRWLSYGSTDWAKARGAHPNSVVLLSNGHYCVLQMQMPHGWVDVPAVTREEVRHVDPERPA